MQIKKKKLLSFSDAQPLIHSQLTMDATYSIYTGLYIGHHAHLLSILKPALGG